MLQLNNNNSDLEKKTVESTQMAPVQSNSQMMPVRSYKDFSPFCFLEVTPLATSSLAPGCALWEALTCVIISHSQSEVGITEYASLGLPDYLLLVGSMCRQLQPKVLSRQSLSG